VQNECSPLGEHEVVDPFYRVHRNPIHQVAARVEREGLAVMAHLSQNARWGFPPVTGRAEATAVESLVSRNSTMQSFAC